MKGIRHSEEQIIAILKQGEAGLGTAELCRQHGISEQTYYPRPGQMRQGRAALQALDRDSREGLGTKHADVGTSLENYDALLRATLE